MVKVPEYQRSETLRPAFRQDIDVRATPDALGAEAGRSMQRVGQAVGQVADAVAKIQAFDDENAAKDADNQFAAWSREKMYGEGGFLTLEGRNAVEGRGKFEEEVEAKRKEFGASLKPGAARMYQRASAARSQSLFQQGITHQAGERKEWYRETSNARTAAFANDALAGYTNPAIVQKNIAAGLLELDGRGEMEGWSAEELTRQKSTFSSGVHAGIVTQMIDADPIAADKYLTANTDALLPADKLKLTRALETPLRAAKTDQWLQEAIGGLPADTNFTSPQTGDMLSAMVPITIQSESGNNPNAVSPVGARGRMQIMPASGRDPGFGIRPWNGTDADNVRFGTEYLGKMMTRYNNDPAKAWAAYNWGFGNLDKALARHGASWLSHAPAETRAYVAKNIKALGSGGGSSGTAAAGNNSGAWLSDLYKKAEAIKDPEDREAAFGAIDRWYNRQQRALGASRQQVMDDIEQRMIADPSFNPSTLPVSTQQVIGLSGMNAFQNAHDRKLTEGSIKTDPVVLDTLLQNAAFDPETFAKTDLTPYRSSLSDQDYMSLRGKQRSAVADTSKALRDGSVYREAISVSKEFYGAAGIRTGSSTAARSEDNRRKEAQFNGAMRQEVDEFIVREKRRPTYDEMRTIASALTINVVGSETRGAWSPGRLFDDDQDDVWTGKAFQRGDAPAGVKRRITPSFADIPTEWVNPIRQSLQKKTGRAPTNTEIATEWGNIALGMIGEN